MQNGYHQDVKYLTVSVNFSHKLVAIMGSFVLDKLLSRKKIQFFDGKTLLYPYKLPEKQKKNFLSFTWQVASKIL